MSRRNRYGGRVLKPISPRRNLADASLDWSSVEDDFDKLMKAKVYKPIIYQEDSENIRSGEDSTDNSPGVLFRSPVKQAADGKTTVASKSYVRPVVSKRQVAAVTATDASNGAAKRVTRARALLTRSPVFKRAVDFADEPLEATSNAAVGVHSADNKQLLGESVSTASDGHSAYVTSDDARDNSTGRQRRRGRRRLLDSVTECSPAGRVPVATSTPFVARAGQPPPPPPATLLSGLLSDSSGGDTSGRLSSPMIHDDAARSSSAGCSVDFDRRSHSSDGTAAIKGIISPWRVDLSSVTSGSHAVTGRIASGGSSAAKATSVSFGAAGSRKSSESVENEIHAALASSVCDVSFTTADSGSHQQPEVSPSRLTAWRASQPVLASDSSTASSSSSRVDSSPASALLSSPAAAAASVAASSPAGVFSGRNSSEAANSLFNFTSRAALVSGTASNSSAMRESSVPPCCVDLSMLSDSFVEVAVRANSAASDRNLSQSSAVDSCAAAAAIDGATSAVDMVEPDEPAHSSTSTMARLANEADKVSMQPPSAQNLTSSSGTRSTRDRSSQSPVRRDIVTMDVAGASSMSPRDRSLLSENDAVPESRANVDATNVEASCPPLQSFAGAEELQPPLQRPSLQPSVQCTPLLASRSGKGWRRSLLLASPSGGSTQRRRSVAGVVSYGGRASVSGRRPSSRRSCVVNAAGRRLTTCVADGVVGKLSIQEELFEEEEEDEKKLDSSERHETSIMPPPFAALSSLTSSRRSTAAVAAEFCRSPANKRRPSVSGGRWRGSTVVEGGLSPCRRVYRRSSVCVTNAADLLHLSQSSCVTSPSRRDANQSLPYSVTAPVPPPAVSCLSAGEARESVLQMCNEQRVLGFATFLKRMQITRKVGEGVYGEVFLCGDVGSTGSLSVVKIMPIEGSLVVNDATQKTFAEILSELIISKHLSELRQERDGCSSDGFVALISSSVVQGKYPPRLRQHWLQYHKQKGSENDDPKCFGSEQLYLVLQYAHAGTDLENFTFDSAAQAVSVFLQVAYSLSVAERRLQFEHRDLHWGNVLVRYTSDQQEGVEATETGNRLNHRPIDLPSSGVQATLIDFTLSRMTVDGKVMFNNLAEDEDLFNSYGDYQFDVYRLMRSATSDEWWRYCARTNALWLHYLWTKLCGGGGGGVSVAFVNASSRTHRGHIRQLARWRDVIEHVSSATELVDKYGAELRQQMATLV